ncbi:MAG TPA: DUF401 family protein [bacterium]|nr:DUF401 family protein [bacterium]
MIWIQVLIPILLMVILLAKKIRLELVLPAGAICMALISGVDLPDIGSEWLNSFINRRSADLFIIIMSVMLLGELMEKGKMFGRMSAIFLKIFKDNRIAAAASAAFIGFLPMPGGSLISAPFVDKLLPCYEQKEKMAVNYWYRHIWEYFFPLYAGLAWIITVMKVPATDLFIYQGAMTVVMASAGLPILLKHRKQEITELATAENPLKLLVISWPILLAVGLSIVFSLDLPWAVLISLIAFIIKERHLAVYIKPFVMKKRTVYVIFLVTGMVFFDSIVRSSGVATGVYEALKGSNPAVFVFLVPMICGVLTGITIGFVSISFPVIYPFLVVNGVVDMNYLLLGFIGGFMGVMLSPMHLCLIVTTDFFKTTLKDVYPYIIKAGVLTLAGGVLYYLGMKLT